MPDRSVAIVTNSNLDLAGDCRDNDCRTTHGNASARSMVSGPAWLLSALVFCGGIASIGAELATSRLIAPYFGSSTFIWSTLIGLTMAFLALGYWLGGRVADRHPDASLLYFLAAIAGLAVTLIPVVAKPILQVSLDAFANLDLGAFYGSLIGTLLLLAIPITLLGFVTPFVIRLRVADVEHAGNTSGSIYALSTVGSILGSFLPVLLFIPLLGTSRTFAVLGVLLFLPAIAGLLATKRLGVGMVLIAGMIATVVATLNSANSGIRPADRGALLDERESAYNYLQVAELDGARLLIMNEGHAVHSIYDPGALLTGGPWDYFMLGPLFTSDFTPEHVRTAMIIGLAGGTAARQLQTVYPDLQMHGVEIDPEVNAMAEEWFGLDEINGLEVEISDGRYALVTGDSSYDLMVIDAYRQPYIPFQLTTHEFFNDVARKLSSRGVVVVNVGRTESDYRLVDAIASTMRSSFDHVYALDVGAYMNTMVIGTNAASSLGDLEQNIAAFPDDSPLRTVAGWAMESGDLREVLPGDTVFTDDHAPVELVIDQIILQAARELTGE